MSNIWELKNRIKTTQNISQITKAMEMVAASKMKKAQAQAMSARPYALALRESLATVSQALQEKEFTHPFMESHDQGRELVIVISTDKGLCGSLNANLFKVLDGWKSEHPEAQVMAVGRKSVLFVRKMGYELHSQFTDLPEYIDLDDVIPILTILKQGFVSKEFKSVYVVYNDFVNTLTQEPVVAKLLPIDLTMEVRVGIEDKAEAEPAEIQQFSKDYEFEPSAEELLTDLLDFYVENSLYHIFLESKASEHSARMVAMRDASENADELLYELNLMFNKTRQEEITNELLDINRAMTALG